LDFTTVKWPSKHTVETDDVKHGYYMRL